MKKKIETLYWDANCLIALFNSEATTDPAYLAALETKFADMLDGKAHICTCALLYVEVFKEPIHKHIYDELVSCPHFSLVETVSSVNILAGEMRQRCNQVGQSLRTADAIHIAAGHLAGADEIWTLDQFLVNKSKIGLLVSTPVIYPRIDQTRMLFGENV